MSEIEKVQEQMKADMEAMKEKMTPMMEAMMSMRRMMEVNTTTVVATSTKSGPDSPTWLYSSKSSILGYGRSGRQSVGKCRRPPFCAGSK